MTMKQNPPHHICPDALPPLRALDLNTLYAPVCQSGT